MRFDIFAADEEDYKELREVWQSAVIATHHFVTRPDLEFYHGMLTDELFERHVVIALKTPHGNIVGFAGIDGDALSMLFVHAEFFGMGIGKRLLSYAVEELGVRKLEVNTQNERAMGFYLRYGFRIVDELPFDHTGRPYPLTRMELPQD